MAKRCIYCKVDLSDDAVVDVCRRCGIGVWGEKMFNAIIENMESARKAGDLYQGSVSTHSNRKPEPKKSALSSIAAEALATQNTKLAEGQHDSYPSQEPEPIAEKEDSASFLVGDINKF